MSDTKKAPLDLVPLRALVGASRVFAHGNTKSVDGKQREPGDFINRPLNGVFYASTMRHTMELQLLQGVVTPESLAHLDADTDLPTIDHLICNLVIIRAMLIRDGLLPVDPGPGRPKAVAPHDVKFPIDVGDPRAHIYYHKSTRCSCGADYDANGRCTEYVAYLAHKASLVEPERVSNGDAPVEDFPDPDKSNYEPVAGMRW